MRSFVFLALLLIGIGGCRHDSNGSSDDPPVSHNELAALLEQKKAEWDAHQLSSYQYIRHNICMHACERVDPMPPQVITVIDGTVTEVFVPALGIYEDPARFETIEYLFQVLQEAIQDNVAVIRENQSGGQSQPVFDETFSHPLRAYVEKTAGDTATAYGFSVETIAPL